MLRRSTLLALACAALMTLAPSAAFADGCETAPVLFMSWTMMAELTQNTAEEASEWEWDAFELLSSELQTTSLAFADAMYAVKNQRMWDYGDFVQVQVEAFATGLEARDVVAAEGAALALAEELDRFLIEECGL